MKFFKKNIFFAITYIFLLIIITIYIYLLVYAKKTIKLSEEKIFIVPPGTNRFSLEKILINEKIIYKKNKFQLLLRLYPYLSKIKAGTYKIKTNMTLEDILLLISNGKEFQFNIRFIEGSCFNDWIKILKKTPYLKHELQKITYSELCSLIDSKKKIKLEGLLYPDTYFYTANTSDIEIIKRAYNRMKLIVNKEWKNRDKLIPYKNNYELLIIASIIEKESKIYNEKLKISSVFINRLKKNMRLQTDPTVIYGLGDKYKGKLYKSNLKYYTQYNTYKIIGLPPTPISMPSIKSIKAAAHPDKTDYLYFVSDGKGGHIFAKNLKEHNLSIRNLNNSIKKLK
ncbi:endolytic transglycosylase MltG [Candidatus Providencia siddallii]|uniref:Endolytic murein transglycosylase n=1 Tax=Candidatus Providencia siddallii TaxID=1715285 RepID=A0ABM9NP65_9GAMM